MRAFEISLRSNNTMSTFYWRIGIAFMSFYQMLKLLITKSLLSFSNQPNQTLTLVRFFLSIKQSIVEMKELFVYYSTMAPQTSSAETLLVNRQSITQALNVTEQSLRCSSLKEQILTCLTEMETPSFTTCVKAMWGTLNSKWWDGSLNPKEWDSSETTNIRPLWPSSSHSH